MSRALQEMSHASQDGLVLLRVLKHLKYLKLAQESVGHPSLHAAGFRQLASCVQSRCLPHLQADGQEGQQDGPVQFPATAATEV